MCVWCMRLRQTVFAWKVRKNSYLHDNNIAIWHSRMHEMHIVWMSLKDWFTQCPYSSAACSGWWLEKFHIFRYATIHCACQSEICSWLRLAWTRLIQLRRQRETSKHISWMSYLRPLLRLFDTVDIGKEYVNLLMTGVKPWTSGVGSDRSTNWATTTT